MRLAVWVVVCLLLCAGLAWGQSEEELLALLASARVEERAAGLRQLRSAAVGPRTIALVSEVLIHDPAVEVQILAAKELERLGRRRDPQSALAFRTHALPALADALDPAQDPRVRRATLEAIRGLGRRARSARVGYALIRSLATSGSSRPAGQALAFMGLPPECEPEFLALLEHEDPEVRDQALRALVWICEFDNGYNLLPSSQIRPRLVELMSHDDAHTRARAAEAIAHLEWGVADLTPSVIETFERALRSPTFQVRRGAARALSTLESPPQAVWAVIAEDALRDPFASYELRRLGQRAYPVVQALALVLRKGRRVERRIKAAELLGAAVVPEDAGLSALLECARDPDAGVRAAVIQAIGAHDPERAGVVSALLTALRDPSESVRSRALIEVGKLGERMPAETCERLLLLSESGSPEERLATIHVLSIVGLPELYPKLLRFLQDPRQDVREASARALKHYVDEHPDEVLAALARAVREDPHYEVRVTAMRSIVSIGVPKGLPGVAAIADVARSSSEEDRVCARWALGEFAKATQSTNPRPRELLWVIPRAYRRELVAFGALFLTWLALLRRFPRGVAPTRARLLARLSGASLPPALLAAALTFHVTTRPWSLAYLPDGFLTLLPPHYAFSASAAFLVALPSLLACHRSAPVVSDVPALELERAEQAASEE